MHDLQRRQRARIARSHVADARGICAKRRFGCASEAASAHKK